jgi:hypothetical protein
MSQSARRGRSALTDISNSLAGVVKKQKLDYFTDTRALEVTAEKLKSASNKARNAVAARIAKQGLKAAPKTPFDLWVDSPHAATAFEAFLQDPQRDVLYNKPWVPKSLEKGMAGTRRKVLEYMFVHVMGAPPEAVWLADGVVSGLMKQLYIPGGSSEQVKNVLRDILKARGKGGRYDKNGGQKRKGKKALIVDGTPQASVVYTALDSGLSTT